MIDPNTALGALFVLAYMGPVGSFLLHSLDRFVAYRR